MSVNLWARRASPTSFTSSGGHSASKCRAASGLVETCDGVRRLVQGQVIRVVERLGAQAASAVVLGQAQHDRVVAELVVVQGLGHVQQVLRAGED